MLFVYGQEAEKRVIEERCNMHCFLGILRVSETVMLIQKLAFKILILPSPAAPKF